MGPCKPFPFQPRWTLRLRAETYEDRGAFAPHLDPSGFLRKIAGIASQAQGSMGGMDLATILTRFDSKWQTTAADRSIQFGPSYWYLVGTSRDLGT